MKHTLSLFFTLLFVSATFAQKLSDEQLQKYLNALQKEQIISEFGKDSFLKTINNENKALSQRMANSPLASFSKIPDSLSKSRAAILGFIGVFELLRNVGTSADEMIQIREMSEKMLGESMFYKPEIEGNIKLNNPITFLGLEQNLKPLKQNYITIANQLKSIHLIDEKVYDELIIWLNKDKIKLIKDFGFFIYAAKQTYFYDNYTALKANQFKFIDSLQNQKLLKASKVQELKKSYQNFELKSKIDILSFCENVIILPAEQKILTRTEIYDELFKEIKEKLLPNFQYKNLVVNEIKNEEANANEKLALSMPFNNPFTKNKKNYKLTFNINNWLYSQKADTDFSFFKTLQKNIPPDIDIDSTIIKSYSNVFAFLTGITNKDFLAINDYLIDQHSNKRIIVVGNDYNPLLSIKEARKAILLVDSLQFKVLENKTKENVLFGKFFGKNTDFSDKNSQENLLKILEDFQEQGIVQNFDAEQATNAIQDLRFEPDNLNNPSRNLLQNLPNICAKVNFIPQKYAEKTLVFKQFMAELSRISKGKFIPEKVTDNFAKEIKKDSKKERELKVSFKFYGKKYEHLQKLPKEIDGENESLKLGFDNIFYNSSEWLEIVNEALENNAVDGKFYKISSKMNFSFTQNIDSYVFLTKNQDEFLEKNYPFTLKDRIVGNIHGNYQEQSLMFNTENFAKALLKEKMLSEENFNKIDLKAVKEPSEVLKQSSDTFIVDLNELSGKSNTEIYLFIFDKINKKISTNFSKITYFKDKKDSSDYDKFTISAIVNSKEYQQTFYTSFEKLVKSGLDSLNKDKASYQPAIGENQFKIVNDYLTDISSPKRLVIICDYQSPKLSFVFFDSTQATIVAETLPSNYVDFLMYDRKFSKDSLIKTLDEFAEIGIISKMNEGQKESFILKFRRLVNDDFLFIQSLPNVIAQTNIWDFETYTNVYKGVMDSLMKVSRNQFKPILLTDNFAKTLKKGNYKNRIFEYGFSLENNKKYEERQYVKALPKKQRDKINYEVFDFDTNKLIELVNKSLNENNTDGAFYQIYQPDEEAGDEVGPKFIFLSSKQYRWIKSKYPIIFESYEIDRSPDIDRIREEK